MNEFIVFFFMTNDMMTLLEISLDLMIYFVIMLATLGGHGAYV
jgi:hypothetical protein